MDKPSLSEKDKEFICWWEARRERDKKVFVQLLIGLPLGLIFTLPILMNFFSGWYKRANMVANTQMHPLVLVIAVLSIIIFYAIFSRRVRWERHEQHYQELKARERE